MLFAAFFLLLNFGISWLNAWVTGKMWAESKAMGGWPRFMAWCAGIMAACGFTWVFTVLLAMGAGAAGWLTPAYVKGAIELGYVVIIFPVLGTGTAIWVDSLATAWRERSFLSVGTAAWNTYAEIHNVYEACSSLPGIFDDLGDLFKGGDDDDAKGAMMLLCLLLVAVSLLGGVFLTIAIVKSSARSTAQERLKGCPA